MGREPPTWLPSTRNPWTTATTAAAHRGGFKLCPRWCALTVTRHYHTCSSRPPPTRRGRLFFLHLRKMQFWAGEEFAQRHGARERWSGIENQACVTAEHKLLTSSFLCLILWAVILGTPREEPRCRGVSGQWQKPQGAGITMKKEFVQLAPTTTAEPWTFTLIDSITPQIRRQQGTPSIYCNGRLHIKDLKSQNSQAPRARPWTWLAWPDCVRMLESLKIRVVFFPSPLLS